MREILSICENTFQNYFSTGAYAVVFIGCIIFLLVNSKMKIYNSRILWYTVIYNIIYWCPVTAKIIMDYCIGRNVYWRMFWTLPVVIIIAYTGVCILECIEEKWKKFIVFVLLLLLFMLSGKFLLTEENFSKPDSKAKLVNGVVNICEALEEDAQNNNIDEIRAIMPPELVCYIRQYDGNIMQAYGRDAIRGEQDSPIYDALSAENIDYEKLIKYATEGKYQYIVYVSWNTEVTDNLKVYGYELVGEVANYNIYRCGSGE